MVCVEGYGRVKRISLLVLIAFQDMEQTPQREVGGPEDFVFSSPFPDPHEFTVMSCAEAEYLVGSKRLITCVGVRGSHLDMTRDSTGLTRCNITADEGVGPSGVRGGVVLGKKRQLS